MESSQEVEQENIQEEVRVGVNFDSDQEEEEVKYFVQEEREDNDEEQFDLQRVLAGGEVKPEQVMRVLME